MQFPYLGEKYAKSFFPYFDYSLPVNYHSLRLSEKAKLDKVQYTAGKIVSGALHLTSKDKLNTELSWESIKSRADFLGFTLFR